MALSEPRISDPNLNGGFLREDARLSLVFVSDEEDQSPYPVDFYLNFFVGLKGVRRSHLFSASAIASPDPVCRTACGDAASPGNRYRLLQERLLPACARAIVAGSIPALIPQLPGIICVYFRSFAD